MKRSLLGAFGQVSASLLLLFTLGALSGCSFAESGNCSSDSDCDTDQRCLRGGGLLVQDGYCVNRALPIDRNQCDGEGELVFDGEPVEPGDPCGPCGDGEIACSEGGEALCTGASEPNSCGGCTPLPAEEGSPCLSPFEEDSILVCIDENSLVCCPNLDLEAVGFPLEDCETIPEELPEVPELFVITESPSTIEIGWQEIQGASGFEVSLDGGSWQTAPEGTSFRYEPQDPPVFISSQRLTFEFNATQGTVESSILVEGDRSREFQFRVRALTALGPGTSSDPLSAAFDASAAPVELTYYYRSSTSGDLTELYSEIVTPGDTVQFSDTLEVGDSRLYNYSYRIVDERVSFPENFIFMGVAYHYPGCNLFPEPWSNESQREANESEFFESFQICNNTCVLTAANNSHCGECNRTCSTLTCSEGSCNDVVQIDAGSEHTCATLADGTAYCWGINVSGQLGAGSTVSGQSTPIPHQVRTTVPDAPLTDVVAVSAGFRHTCAILSNGEGRCWGSMEFGRLGNNQNSDSFVPSAQVVSDLTSAVALSAGRSQTCAITSNQEPVCWGLNDFNRISPQATEVFSVPTMTTAGFFTSEKVEAIDTGPVGVTCAVSQGDVYCFGENNNGLLGTGGNNKPSSNFNALNLSSDGEVTDVSVGASHACALVGGRVFCWGRNNVGQLGLGVSSGPNMIFSPSTVIGINNAVAITTGRSHTCALLDSSDILCWGENGAGQLGNGGTSNENAPFPISGGGFVAITAGDSHTCGLRSGGEIRCWGSNQYNQLGVPNIPDTNLPTPVDWTETLFD